MQTSEELTRRFPDKSCLSSLRQRILSSEPELELDLEIHKLFCRFPAEFVNVEKTLIYRVENQADYKAQRSEWLWSRNDSVGWIDGTGVTHYWGGEPPGFWDDWMPIPRYMTRVEDAFDLKWDLLASEVHLVLEEHVNCEVNDDRETFTRAYSVKVLGRDQKCVSTLELQSPAKAVVLAIIEYLLTIDDAE